MTEPNIQIETPPTLREYEAAITAFVAEQPLDEAVKADVVKRLIAAARELLDETALEMSSVVTGSLALVLLRIYEKGSSPGPFNNAQLQQVSEALIRAHQDRKTMQQIMQVLGPKVPEGVDYTKPENAMGLIAEHEEALKLLRAAGIEYKYKRRKNGEDES